ncbi:MAG: methyltransferase domain-containing protein [Spirochaetales bacterium]|nr:methyltransferase domain-containing protein [Spirochaetales bacterium]
MTVKELFDKSAGEYDKQRRMLVPCFDDFYGTALDLVPFEEDSKFSVLDLGAGTGLFSDLLLWVFPNAEFTLFDISEDMLAQAKKRFDGTGRDVKYIAGDYAATDIHGKFDLIISGLSIHHLEDGDKQSLFSRLPSKLNRGGLFINADQVLGDTPAIEEVYRSTWLRQVKERGAGDEVLDAALERMKSDKMTPLQTQLDWLKDAGFDSVNCWYQNYSFAVYSAIKS